MYPAIGIDKQENGMAYQIEVKAGYVEVRLSGTTSKDEVCHVLRELARRDPRKEIPDLWIVSPESQVPLVHFADIAQEVGRLVRPDAVCRKSAIVAFGEFHKAQLEMYRFDAAFLPFETRVFLYREEALKWLLRPEPAPAP
jgi:hypothetical protein